MRQEMHTYSFEKLEAWKLSKDFVIEIYELVKKYPKSEKYGIIDQVKRAAVSVPTNLSEGSGRNAGKDKAHFTQIAYGSIMECLNLLLISRDLGFITNENLDEFREKIEIITVKLSNLRKSQLKGTSKQN